MKKLLILSIAAVVAVSCNKDKDPVIIVPPSSGATMTLNGGNGGASAENSVYVDFSKGRQDSVKRASWDLGFYTGSDFRVIINNTAFAMGHVTTKTDISAVSTADTVGVTIRWSQSAPPAASGVADAVSGDLTKTLIPAISANASENKVIILNRLAQSTAPKNEDFVKLKITRNGDGYTLQYATLNSTDVKTIQISKYLFTDFVRVSLNNNGTIVSGFPDKKEWDIVWTFSSYEIPFGAITAIYQASDYVLINSLNNVQVAKVTYSDATAATEAYTKFNKDSVAKYSLVSDRIAIGSGWRATTGTIGVYKNIFYIVKDTEGNFYKLKFLSFHASDGGERGKPQISYELIK